ncbi:hypothetical protein P691DRAFT_495372 [Macrolepiota fuliginosa MF-IS2]|uniref:Uncharacterized protein n=1 Tax=Macrolepiota fuliginosa MF-IS2 TaxID=1400762 RepID=A0A9P5X0B9_9AGAR|nr:hypothetical protein P691DRAFT_495372 [Macrolepiota fuliginosa MF-IS2]
MSSLVLLVLDLSLDPVHPAFDTTLDPVLDLDPIHPVFGIILRLILALDLIHPVFGTTLRLALALDLIHFVFGIILRPVPVLGLLIHFVLNFALGLYLLVHLAQVRRRARNHLPHSLMKLRFPLTGKM